MKIYTVLFSLQLLAPALAQEDAAASRRQAPADLQKLLRGAAGGDGVVFDVTWKWPVTSVGSATTSRSGGSREQHMQGRFDRQALRTNFDAGRLGKVSVLKTGRYTIARDGDGPWRLDNLAGARALGLSFMPDPQLMLLTLAAAGPKASNREIVAVDGRAIERIGATLEGEQVVTLVRAGAIHDPNPSGELQRRLRMAGRGRARKNVQLVPIDVVIDVDVKTRNVLRVGFRAIAKESGFLRAMRRQRGQGGGAMQQAQGREPQVDTEPEVIPDGPLQYENGMPTRSHKGKSIYTIEVKFNEHGKQSAIQLDAAQKRLLGR